MPTALRYGSRAAPARRRLFGRRGKPARRLLIARSEHAGTVNRRVLAERALFEERASARGFALVRPERLAIPEQIARFQSGAAPYGEYGSGLHGSLLAPEGAAVIALREGGLDGGFLQTSLGHASGLVVGTARSPEGFFSVRPEDIDLALDWLDLRERA